MCRCCGGGDPLSIGIPQSNVSFQCPRSIPLSLAEAWSTFIRTNCGWEIQGRYCHVANQCVSGFQSQRWIEWWWEDDSKVALCHWTHSYLFSRWCIRIFRVTTSTWYESVGGRNTKSFPWYTATTQVSTPNPFHCTLSNTCPAIRRIDALRKNPPRCGSSTEFTASSGCETNGRFFSGGVPCRN